MASLESYKDQYRVLGHEGLGFTEIRIPKKGIQVFVDNYTDYCTEVYKHLGGDAYVGINPRKDKNGTTQSISWITNLVVDIDPVRPVDTPSSSEAHGAALELASKISAKYPGSIVVSSGSGAHVYIPIEPIEPSKEIGERIKAWVRGLRQEYETDTLKIDNISDFPRIIRVWGSWNEKSKRPCEPIDSVGNLVRTNIEAIVPKITMFVQNEQRPINEQEKIPNGFRNSRLTSLAGSMRRKGFSESGILAALMDENLAKCVPPLSESEVKGIASSVGRYSPTNETSSNIKTASEEYFKGLGTRKPGIMTGFKTLDEMLAGLKSGRLYVIAARPTEGKTTLLTQIAKNLTINGSKVLFFPTEVGATSILDKIISSSTGVNLRKFQWGSFTSEDRDLLNRNRGESEFLNKLAIAEDFSLTTKKIEETIKQVMPDVVIVDFLQSMFFEEGGSPKELSQAVVALKSMAGKYQVPMILASQLSRSADSATASLGHLKGSGALEEQGDDIIFLHTLDKLVYPRPVNLMIMKSKYGECGIVKLEFFASTCEFKERQ